MTILTGNIATRLVQNNWDVNALRTNATLRKDEWIRLDQTVIRTARIRLNAVADVVSRGFVDRINGLRTQILQWERESRTEEVNVSMDPQVLGRSEAVDFDLVSLPLPIFHANYTIGIRQLETSRNTGQPLNTSMARNKTRDVAEKVEDTLVNGLDGYKYGSGSDQGTVYGYLDFPDRGTYTIPAAWDLPATTGKDIVTDVLAMRQLAIDAKHYGPYILYVPANYEGKLDEDYSENKGDNTIRERILNIDSIEEVKVLDTLPDDNVVLVQMTRDTVEMVEGLPLSNTEWDTRGGMSHNFMIWTIMIPRLISDYEGNCGIVQGSV